MTINEAALYDGAEPDGKPLTPAEQHRAYLADHTLVGIEKIGREETFTGVLVATLLNKTAQSVILTGLGLPLDFVLDGVFTAVEPIDLVLIGTDRSGTRQGCVIEVKWLRTKSNYPGYTAYAKQYPFADDKKEIPLHDAAPSQLDRAHQLVMEYVHGSSPCHCGYQQTCHEHGCLRGCHEDAKHSKVTRWTGWPKEYPFDSRGAHGLRLILDNLTPKIDTWRFLFLDYENRPASEAFIGTCNRAWEKVPAPMSTLAAEMQKHYKNALAQDRPNECLANALEPLLRFMYSN